MLTLDVMNEIRLSKRPIGQVAMASMVLLPNYKLPWTKTDITIEGFENIPQDHPVIFAMNHTDRYNYWPFQFELWKNHGIFTTTWVKGKYYNKPAIQRFMVAMSNIPVPSRGYLITADAVRLLGRPPADQAYRLLRDAIDSGERETRPLRERAAAAGVLSDVVTVLDTPRNMLGLDFDPNRSNYLETMHRLFKTMMERFVALNEEAFALGLHILVFPEGTRSIRLGKGHNGIAQMALRLGATVVPIGCNGSDKVYPGNSPFSSGGRIVYRVGQPLTPEGDLAPFQIDERYTPFTQQAETTHKDKFEAMTGLVMDRINELLDPRHQRSEDSKTIVEGAKRFL
jgi:1-acyl-sn-glycerol-3-phosphate acyltransferase